MKVGTIIAKHTDKVDKDIKTGKIVRLHIPVITHEEVLMTSWLPGGIAEFHMKKYSCWWLDVSQPHKVVNKSDIDRVHLVIDIYNNDDIKTILFMNYATIDDFDRFGKYFKITKSGFLMCGIPKLRND